MNSQNDSAFSRGNATSGAPICSGMIRLPNAKNSGVANISSISVPCIVNSWLYCSGDRNCMPRLRQLRAHQQRHDAADHEERERAAMYIRPMVLWSVVRSRFDNREPLTGTVAGLGRLTIGAGAIAVMPPPRPEPARPSPVGSSRRKGTCSARVLSRAPGGAGQRRRPLQGRRRHRRAFLARPIPIVVRLPQPRARCHHASMSSDVVVDVSALAINVPIPEALRWTDTRRGQEFLLTTLNVRLLRDGHLAAKAYGRPTAGGRGTYVSFPVPDREGLADLVSEAARRAGELWSAHRGLD